MSIYFVSAIGWLVGTVIALRFIKSENNPWHLTRAGKIFYASLVGVVIAVIVVLINGMWWNCDLNGQCSYTWGY